MMSSGKAVPMAFPFWADLRLLTGPYATVLGINVPVGGTWTAHLLFKSFDVAGGQVK